MLLAIALLCFVVQIALWVVLPASAPAASAAAPAEAPRGEAAALLVAPVDFAG